MKFTKIIIAMAMLVGLTASAVQSVYEFANGAIETQGTNSYTVVSANSATGGQPLVTFLSYTTTNAGSGLRIASCTNSAVVTGANSTTNIPVGSTNGMVSGGIIIIRHVSTDTYERRVIGGVSTTNLPVTVALTASVAAGDIVYPAFQSAFIVTGTTTNQSITGPGIYSGPAQYPLLIEAAGGTLFGVCARYVP